MYTIALFSSAYYCNCFLQMLLLATFFPASETADVEPIANDDDIVTVSYIILLLDVYQ